MRTISLDARSASQVAAEVADLRNSSPSQNSLASLSSVSNTPLSPHSPHTTKHVNRCISPLLIPPRIQSNTDPTMGPASPLGAIQPDLYRGPDGPIYLNAPENSPALGRLHLRVKYDYHLFDLTVHLIEGEILMVLEAINSFLLFF